MFKEIAGAIKKYKRFIVTTHIHPDGDAVGSEIVFLELLRTLKKEAIAVNDTPLPALYGFLPGSEKLLTKISENFAPQAAIVLDTPTLKRLGRIKEYVDKVPFIVNIDHHISNTKFGNINWVNPDASAVAEDIVRLLDYLKIGIKRQWAVCLYTAILTDTGSFRYMNTTSKTHKIAARLLECGVRPEGVAQKIYENNTLKGLRSIGHVLENIKTASDGEIAWVCVPPYEKYESDEDIVAYPRSISSVKIAILFRELKYNRVKISFRSKGGVDVNALAQKFGGGGHPAASGCVVKGRLSQVQKKIIEEAREYLRRSKEVA